MQYLASRSLPSPTAIPKAALVELHGSPSSCPTLPALQVKLWDLRGGSSGALRFGGTVHHHPLLDSLSLRLALTAVPGLADQTAIPASGVQWLQVGWGGDSRAKRSGKLALRPHRHVIIAATQPRADESCCTCNCVSTSASGITPTFPAVSRAPALLPSAAVSSPLTCCHFRMLQCDPRDERRLGFHLGCGWSGVLDLTARTITHLHAPPPLQQHLGGDVGVVASTAAGSGMEFAPGAERCLRYSLARGHCKWAPCAVEQSGAGTPCLRCRQAPFLLCRGHQNSLCPSIPTPTPCPCATAMHRRPCWSPCGSHLAVPARHADALQLLDFAPSRQAAGAVPSGAEEEVGSSRSRSWGQPDAPPPAVDVQLSQPAVCAAAHPSGGLLVAGGQGAKLSVVASR